MSVHFLRSLTRTMSEPGYQVTREAKKLVKEAWVNERLSEISQDICQFLEQQGARGKVGKDAKNDAPYFSITDKHGQKQRVEMSRNVPQRVFKLDLEQALSKLGYRKSATAPRQNHFVSPLPEIKPEQQTFCPELQSRFESPIESILPVRPGSHKASTYSLQSDPVTAQSNPLKRGHRLGIQIHGQQDLLATPQRKLTRGERLGLQIHGNNLQLSQSALESRPAPIVYDELFPVNSGNGKRNGQLIHGPCLGHTPTEPSPTNTSAPAIASQSDTLPPNLQLQPQQSATAHKVATISTTERLKSPPISHTSEQNYLSLFEKEANPFGTIFHKQKAKFYLSTGGKSDGFNASKQWLDRHHIKLNLKGKYIDKDWSCYDLSGIGLDRIYLQQINASKANMERASLVNAHASHCVFDGAILTNVDARRFMASNSIFRDATISGNWCQSSPPAAIRDREMVNVKPETILLGASFPHPSWKVVYEQMKDSSTPTLAEAFQALRKQTQLSSESSLSSVPVNR